MQKENLSFRTHRMRKVQIDHTKVLAVQFNGVVGLLDGMFDHSRIIYTGDGQRTVIWTQSKSINVIPSAIAELDKLGGKPYTEVGRTLQFGTGNSNHLRCAPAIRISKDPKDSQFIQVQQTGCAKLAGETEVCDVFKERARVEKHQQEIVMHHALLSVGQFTISVAHLNEERLYFAAPPLQ